MRCYFLFACLLVALNTNAQSGHDNDTVIKGVTYLYVEQMPKTGYDLSEYIAKNLHAGDSEQSQDMQGTRVIVKFIVNEDGSTSDISVVRSVNNYYDNEVVRLVRNMPRWKPGEQNGKPVKVWFTLPVVFKLQ